MIGHDDVLVSTQWLADHLGVSDQRIVDCSWYPLGGS